MQRLTQDLSCEALDIFMEFPRCTPGLDESSRDREATQHALQKRIFLPHSSALAPIRRLDGWAANSEYKSKIVPELAPVLRVPSPSPPKGRHQLRKKASMASFSSALSAVYCFLRRIAAGT